MTSLFRRHIALCVLGSLAAMAAALPAHAQSTYPTKPIRIIVPYPAGGTTDQVARMIAQPMQELLGQTVIIDNKPGAGGTIGTDLASKQPADGYTLLFGNSGPSATAALMRKLPYDIHKDFRPISAVITVPLILAISADSPHKTLKDFLEWARSQGTSLNYGSTGMGGSSHLASEYLNDLAGLKVQHIPYGGGAPIITAFGGGQIQMAFVTGLDGATGVAAGKIRYLAAASPTRTDVLPGLPAIAEEVPGFKAVVWFGLLAPKAVPDDIAAKLATTVAKVMQRPEIRKFFSDRNVEPRGSTPEELARIIDGELAQWGPLIKKANISM